MPRLIQSHRAWRKSSDTGSERRSEQSDVTQLKPIACQNNKLNTKTQTALYWVFTICEACAKPRAQQQLQQIPCHLLSAYAIPAAGHFAQLAQFGLGITLGCGCVEPILQTRKRRFGSCRPGPSSAAGPSRSAPLPGRLREGRAACKELSGRQCCGSVEERAGLRRAAAGGGGAGSWGWSRAAQGSERGGGGGGRSPAPAAARGGCLRGASPRHGAPAVPPARARARLAGARLSLLASARLPSSPAGVANASSSPATAVAAAAIQDARSPTFPLEARRMSLAPAREK